MIPGGYRLRNNILKKIMFDKTFLFHGQTFTQPV